MNNKLVNHTSDQMKTKQYLFSLGLIGALAFGGGQASAQYVPFDDAQAALLNVTLDSLALEVTGKWDPRGGRPGFEQVPLYPTDIHYTLHVKTPESEARIEELLAAVEKICPMYNLFIDAPQTFEAKIVRVGRK